MSPKSDKAKITEAAEKYVRQGRIEDAIEEYEKLLTGSPEDIPINNIIGDLYVRLGQTGRAVRVFKTSAAHYEKNGLYSQALALYKKINKLDPADLECLLKLGELYGNMGFVSEAKAEYSKAAERLEKENRLDTLISLYEKLIQLDRNDFDSRFSLARCYYKTGELDKAVAELNEVAESKMEKNEFKEAERILNEARKLKEDDLRTLSSLIKILKRDKRHKEAITLLERDLDKKKRHPVFLNLLANLYFEEQNYKKAEEMFSLLFSNDPENVDVRAKLGYAMIRLDDLDKAFELYEPLVSSFINKNQEDKAIGLLGLILMSKKIHIPSLEKLASIYKLKDQKKNLEIVNQLLLEEYRHKKLKDKTLLVLKDLMILSPEKPEFDKEYKRLRKEFKLPEDTKEKISFLTEKDKEIIKTNLAKVEAFLEQGLPRNARRILDNLKLLYPEEPSIQQKWAQLGQQPPEIGVEEIPQIVDKVSQQETRGEKVTFDYGFRETPAYPEEEKEGGEKVSVQEIFAETDLIPIVPEEEKEREYFDLGEKIEEELETIEAIFYKQLKEKEWAIEKELTDIVTEFRKQVEQKIDKRNYEARYHLGMAFMEQGLIEEAIEEFKMAANDEERAADSFSLISQCYKQKRNFQEAVYWMEEALKHAEEKSDQQFALKYDLASLYEEVDANREALDLYQEVKAWNAQYRDVAKRVRILEKIT